MNVELYSKPQCSLCDEARAALIEMQKELPFELLEIDIDRDPVLKQRFKLEIPVVFVDGRKLSKLKVDPEALRNRLERARSFSLGTLDPQKTLSRTAPVSRGTKVAFAIAAVFSIAAVFASTAYTKFVLDPRRALVGLNVLAQDRPAPDFELSGPGGTSRTLATYKGKLLVLNFFATWCGPCREEIPSLSALAKATQGENMAVLAVSVQEDWPTINRFFGADPPDFGLALDANGHAAQAYEQKPELQFPETYIIAPDGKVVAKLEGPRDWTDPTMLRYLRGLSRS